MSKHRVFLCNYAKLGGDWSSYKIFSARFNRELDKYNKKLEKRTTSSKRRSALFRYLRGKLSGRQHLSGLSVKGQYFPNDFDKANPIADEFAKVFCKDGGGRPPISFSVQNKTTEYPYFEAATIYEQISRWPVSNAVTPVEIPFLFIRNITHAIAFPLAYLSNQSITFLEVPSLREHSYVQEEPASDSSN